MNSIPEQQLMIYQQKLNENSYHKYDTKAKSKKLTKKLNRKMNAE